MKDKPHEQMTLDGRDLMEIGTQAALDAIPEWAEKARATALRLLKERPFITSEDMTDHAGTPHIDGGANRNNAVGAVFSGLANQGLIKHVGWVQANNPQSHARMIRKWALQEANH